MGLVFCMHEGLQSRSFACPRANLGPLPGQIDICTTMIYSLIVILCTFRKVQIFFQVFSKLKCGTWSQTPDSHIGLSAKPCGLSLDLLPVLDVRSAGPRTSNNHSQCTICHWLKR